jgi:hypothetical protein
MSSEWTRATSSCDTGIPDTSGIQDSLENLIVQDNKEINLLGSTVDIPWPSINKSGVSNLGEGIQSYVQDTINDQVEYVECGVKNYDTSAITSKVTAEIPDIMDTVVSQLDSLESLGSLDMSGTVKGYVSKLISLKTSVIDGISGITGQVGKALFLVAGLLMFATLAFALSIGPFACIIASISIVVLFIIASYVKERIKKGVKIELDEVYCDTMGTTLKDENCPPTPVAGPSLDMIIYGLVAGVLLLFGAFAFMKMNARS